MHAERTNSDELEAGLPSVEVGDLPVKVRHWAQRRARQEHGGGRGRFSAVLLSLAIVFLARAAPGQDLGVRGSISPIHSVGRFTIVVENDLFWPRNGTDWLYSNGLFLHSEWNSPWLAKRTRKLHVGPLVATSPRAYLGFGVAHELHTPKTLNPCGRFDPLATAEAPRDVGAGICAAAEADWQRNYAERDRPFSAVASVFVTAQRYLHADQLRGAFTQARLWGRVDGGKYGSDGALGYEVQKHWHGFFNDTLLAPREPPAQEPVGWTLAPRTNRLLVELSVGADLSLFRATLPHARFGAEFDGRGQVRVGTPRTTLGVGPTARVGWLPVHASRPLPQPDRLSPFVLYIEGSLDTTLVGTDATYGDIDEYRHFLFERAAGATMVLCGLSLSARLNWQQVLFKEPLQRYPSTALVLERYHQYGSFVVAFEY